MRWGFFVVALAGGLLAGCASIVAESSDQVLIQTNPEGANLTVFNRDGQQVFAGTSPTSALLHVGHGYFSGETFTIKAAKDGYQSTATTLDTSLCNWYWGNLIFGGLIGLFAVDPATGAMWDLPEATPVISLLPAPSAAPAPPTAQAPLP